MRTGIANLPLHGGHAPPWLFKRMVMLGREISEVIIDEYSTDEFLRRLSDPFWFQAFSCVLGYDWHSSGTTTVTMGALKEALGPELGVAVCGGKGRTSRKTPDEIVKFGDVMGVEHVDGLVNVSRLVAKVDNSALQDGYHLYHHTFVLDEHGHWVVVQQGMNGSYARRYHWIWGGNDFVNAPPREIAAQRVEKRVLDLTSRQNSPLRSASVDVANDFKELTMPPNHEIKITKPILKTLEKVREIRPKDFKELISIQGVGEKTLRALALVSNVIYGAPIDWKDPAKFSYAHGGKDGIPYPVDRGTYDKTIEILKSAVDSAKIGERDRIRAIKRLNDFLTDPSY